MKARGRLLLFALAGPALAAVLVIGFTGLPSFGDYHGVYGAVVTGVELTERHATDYVTALNFDLRAFDTLGEEFILFASVTGVLLLLRAMRDEQVQDRHDDLGAHDYLGSSAALRVLALLLAVVLTALGGYVVLHGALTPGGGFQGGVVLAAGPIAVVVAGRFLAVRGALPEWALEALDAVGAAAYALLGLAGLVLASVYMKNFISLGIPGHLLSAGFMPLNSIAVGLEVTGGFLLILTEYLDQALLIRRGQS
ncbi:MAG: MnhB domain-containing protein [Solirubrobacteraceae bacterium]